MLWLEVNVDWHPLQASTLSGNGAPGVGSRCVLNSLGARQFTRLHAPLREGDFVAVKIHFRQKSLPVSARYASPHRHMPHLLRSPLSLRPCSEPPLSPCRSYMRLLAHTLMRLLGSTSLPHGGSPSAPMHALVPSALFFSHPPTSHMASSRWCCPPAALRHGIRHCAWLHTAHPPGWPRQPFPPPT